MRNLVKSRFSVFSSRRELPLKTTRFVRTVHMKSKVIKDESGHPLAVISEQICNKQLPQYQGKPYLDESWRELGDFTQRAFNPQKEEQSFWIGAALQTIYTPMGTETKEGLQVYVNESHCLSAICSLKNTHLTVNEKTIIDFGSHQPTQSKDVVIHYNGRELWLKNQEYQAPAIHNRSSRRIQLFLSNPMGKESSEGAKMIMFMAPLNQTNYTLEQIIQYVETVSQKRIYVRRESACSHALVQGLDPNLSLSKDALPIQALAESAKLLYKNKSSFVQDQIADGFFPYLDYPLELGLRHKNKKQAEIHVESSSFTL